MVLIMFSRSRSPLVSPLHCNYHARWVVKGLRIWPRESNDRVLKGSGYCPAAQNNGSALLPTRHHENHGFKYKIAENTKWLAVVVQWISSLEANSSPVSIEVRFSFVCLGQSTLLGKFKVLLPWTPKTELS